MWLPWFDVQRPAELGPGRVDGWEAFSRLDAAIVGAGVLTLLAPLMLPRPAARLLASVLAAGAALIVAYKLVRLTVVSPVSVAPQDSTSFVRADRALIGPYIALAAAAALAGASALGAWRSRLERSWPAPTTVVAGLTALAAVLRFATLGEQTLWYDELATAEAVKGSVSSSWEAYKATEGTPPLFYALTWIWTHLFGSGDGNLRVVSAAATTAAVPVTFLAGRAFVSERVGLLAAALVAVNPTLVWYGQEARAYGLLVLFVGLTLLATARVRRTPRAGAVAIWAITAALALSVHFFAVFLIMAEAIVIVRVCRPAALAPAALLVPVALALVALADRLGGGTRTSFINTLPLADRAGDVARELVSANTWVVNTHQGTSALDVGLPATIALVAAVIAALASRRRTGARVPLLLGAAALLVPFALTPTRYDFLLDRNLLAAWIPLAIALAAALAVLPRAACALAVTVLVTAGLITNVRTAVDPGLQRQDWRTAVARLGTRPQGRVVMVLPAFYRDVVSRYGPSTNLLGPTGIRAREVALLGPYDASRVAAGLPGFSVVAGPPADGVEVTTLRASRSLLITPESAGAAGVDPLGVLVEPSDRAVAWIEAVTVLLGDWKVALEDDPQVLANGASDELEPAPPDIPGAARTTRLAIVASDRGARWASALASGSPDADAAAAAFERAIARVPGASEFVAQP